MSRPEAHPTLAARGSSWKRWNLEANEGLRATAHNLTTGNSPRVFLGQGNKKASVTRLHGWCLSRPNSNEKLLRGGWQMASQKSDLDLAIAGVSVCVGVWACGRGGRVRWEEVVGDVRVRLISQIHAARRTARGCT